MTLNETLKELESLGSEKLRAQNIKHGAGKNQFGVKLGDLRKLAKSIKINHKLALDLWKTENVDARFLAILLVKVNSLTAQEVDQMVQSIKFDRVADWFNSYVINKHPDKESLRIQWLESSDAMSARSGWSLTAERIAKDPEGLDIDGILGRLEAEMAKAHPLVQWTMNFALAFIGIHFPKHRERAIAIGESLGIYKDYPVSKGCTSPYAPIWINEMVNRQA